MLKKDVIQYFGSQVSVANFLTSAGHKISQAAVSKWPDNVPELRAHQLEKLTDGKLQANPPQPILEEQLTLEAS